MNGLMNGLMNRLMNGLMNRLVAWLIGPQVLLDGVVVEETRCLKEGDTLELLHDALAGLPVVMIMCIYIHVSVDACVCARGCVHGHVHAACMHVHVRTRVHARYAGVRAQAAGRPEAPIVIHKV